MSNIIEVYGLCKKYKDFELKDVSFEVQEGSIMGLVGQNGAGKSTTLSALMDIISTDGGSIKIMGMDNVKHRRELSERIGVVFDDLLLPDVLNANEIDRIFGGIYKGWDRKMFFDYIDTFKLPRTKQIKQYSRGMRMKLSITCALSHNPDLLILDEPTGGLDPIIRAEILDIMQEFVLSEKKSILFSTHITSDLERIADYITFIDNGSVILSEEKLKMSERHMLYKCKTEDFVKVDKTHIVGSRTNAFGTEFMVDDACAFEKQNMGFVAQRPSIDDIMLYYILGRHNK